MRTNQNLDPMKMLLKIFSLLFFSLFICACTQPTDGGTAAQSPSETASLEVDGTFGDSFTPDQIVAAPEMLSRYDEKQLADTVRTTLRGQVNEVCQAKGCWMTIATGTESEMMVKFKDYAFFMPMDISGREVLMNGMAYYQITPVDELRHYAEDAGKSSEEIAMITEPKKELRFLADGVKLLK